MIIKANNIEYEGNMGVSELGAITIIIQNKDYEELLSAFKVVKKIEIINNDIVIGKYENVEFESITTYSDNRIAIKMQLLNETEIEIKSLKEDNEQLKKIVDCILT